MAEFNANINLDVQTKKALKGVSDVEKAVNRLAGAADKVNVRINGLDKAADQAQRLLEALESIENATLSRLPREFQILVAYLKAANTQTGKLVVSSASALVKLSKTAKTDFSSLISQVQKVSDILSDVENVQITVAQPRNIQRLLGAGGSGSGGFGGSGGGGGGGGGGGRFLPPGRSPRFLPPGRSPRFLPPGRSPRGNDGPPASQALVDIEAERLDSLTEAFDRLIAKFINKQKNFAKAFKTGVESAAINLDASFALLDTSLEQFRQKTIQAVKNFDPKTALSSIKNAIDLAGFDARLAVNEAVKNNNFLQKASFDTRLVARSVSKSRIVDFVYGSVFDARLAVRGALKEFKLPKTSNNNVNSAVNRINKFFTETRKQIANIKEAVTEGTKRLSKTANQGNNRGGRQRNVLGSALVGGAFPALFGGGPGAIIGGFVGELFGPLNGVVGSALGSQFDTATQGATKLGQALGALEPDINLLVSSIGEAGTSTGQLIQKIGEAEGAQVAQAIAAERLAVVVGQDGVDALRSAGDAATELGNEASKAFSALSAALAPALEAVANFLAKNIKEQRQLSRVDQGVLGFGRGDLAGREDVQKVFKDFRESGGGLEAELEARRKLLAIVEQTETKEREILDKRLESNRTIKDTLGSAQDQLSLAVNQLTIAEGLGDLRNEAVFKAAEENIKLEFIVKTQEILNEEVKTEADQRIRNLKILALQKQELAALAALESKRSKAASKGLPKTPPQPQKLSLEQQIIREQIKQDQIANRLNQIKFGEEAALDDSLVSVTRRLAAESQIIEKQRQQALERNKIPSEEKLINDLFDSRQKSLQDQLTLETARNRQRLEAIALERQLASLQGKQQVTGVSRQLNQELAQANFRPTGIGDEAAQLKLQQAQRYETVLAGINDQIAELEKKATSPLPEVAKQAKEALPFLEQQRDLYKQLLPQIFAAEQAQLKFNQTLQAVSGPVNAGVQALVGGLRDVVAGTKSAEEAFADFLNAIANALIQTAATLIAQYIAIGIARKFAGIPPASSGNDTAGLPRISNSRDLFNGSIPFFGTQQPRLFADGGRPPVDKPSIVGERGPELFVPDTAGTIIPNEAFDDARGALRPQDPQDSSDASDAFIAAAGALERNTQVINNRQTTTQQETSFNSFTEAMMRPGQSTVRFETVRVGDMDMVTKDEALEIGARSAKAAEANVFSALRNKPSVRRSLGMS